MLYISTAGQMKRKQLPEKLNKSSKIKLFGILVIKAAKLQKTRYKKK